MGVLIRTKLEIAARKVWFAFKALSEKAGDTVVSNELETAILELRLAEKNHEAQTSDERRILVNIVNVADGFGSPAFKSDDMSELHKAIDAARQLIKTGGVVAVQK